MASESAREELLSYYEAELDYLRGMGSAFAETYPRVAGRLELTGDECPDPNVERLIESFAFLTGRIQRRLDHDLPEVTTGLLGLLHPHLVAPLPAATIARFEVDPARTGLTTGYRIERETPLVAATDEGHACRFRTCYPVTLWPLEVAEAAIEPPELYELPRGLGPVEAVLRVRLRSLGDDLETLDVPRLRFYLDGDMRTAGRIYELLFAHARGVALRPEGAERPILLPGDPIRPVGFGPDEEVLPHPPGAHPGYRLLQEYFAVPRKFLFFDVEGLAGRMRGRTTDLLVLLDRGVSDRLRIDHRNFALGCTPVVNLFRRTSEPIRLDHRRSEYRLVADARRERTTEIHSVLRVSATRDGSTEVEELAPFFSQEHRGDARAPTAYWYARRAIGARRDLEGTDLWLSLVDLDFHPTHAPDRTVYAHLLCTNRRLAEQLPDTASLQIESAAPLHRIVALHPPTRCVEPVLGGANLWRLVSHLSLNHLGITGGPAGARALRELLRLYAPYDRASLQEQVEGITAVDSRPVVRLTGREAWRGFCRGTEITLTLDESAFAGSSAFLLAAVLEHFFGLYATLNSFTQLVIRSQQREGAWKRWPPRAGEQILL